MWKYWNTVQHLFNYQENIVNFYKNFNPDFDELELRTYITLYSGIK